MEQLLNELENLLRDGQHNSVKNRLSSLKRSQIPTQLRWRFAAIARRARFPNFSLRLLNPIIRSEHLKPVVHEIAEYALALNQIGAHDEAMNLLMELSPESIPEYDLYLAFSHIYQWNYSEAISSLKAYLSLSTLSDYQRLVAKTNLAAAYLAEYEEDSAKVILQDLQDHLMDTDYEVLKGNVLELSAQLAFLQKDWELCGKYLKRAEDSLGLQQNTYSLFIQKWKAILNLYQQGLTAATIDQMEQIKLNSTHRGLWETIRECEFYQALITRDSELATKIYFGTPYHSYRRKMTQLLGDTLQLPEFYDWNPHSSKSGQRIFSIQTGKGTHGEPDLGTQPKLLSLMTALTLDFFKPISLGSLFSHIFPGEYFDPASSPNRVHQLIKRLRDWCAKNNMPIQIHHNNGTYLLRTTEPYGIRLLRNRHADPSSLHPALCEIRLEFLGTEFSVADVTQRLRVSKSTAKRILKEGRSLEWLEAIGTGPKTRYRFLNKTSKAA